MFNSKFEFPALFRPLCGMDRPRPVRISFLLLCPLCLLLLCALQVSSRPDELEMDSLFLRNTTIKVHSQVNNESSILLLEIRKNTAIIETFTAIQPF